MLESSTFVIRQPGTPPPGLHRLDIEDEGTGGILGCCLIRFAKRRGLLSWLLGRTPAGWILEVRETLDHSLLFTVHHRVGWLWSELLVLDAVGQLVASSSWRGNNPTPGSRVFLQGHKAVARLEGDFHSFDLWFRTEVGAAELANVMLLVSGEPECPPLGCVLQVNPAVGEQPLLKMLLLGVTLALFARTILFD